MKLEEAVDLARGVMTCDSRVMIIAIGRFLPSDQIKPDSPWMISIHEPGHERPRILRQTSDISQFQPKALSPASLRQAVDSERPSAASRKRAGQAAEPMLF